jgi:hypothetical protein
MAHEGQMLTRTRADFHYLAERARSPRLFAQPMAGAHNEALQRTRTVQIVTDFGKPRPVIYPHFILASHFHSQIPHRIKPDANCA